jgi:hypothetical protein
MLEVVAQQRSNSNSLIWPSYNALKLKLWQRVSLELAGLAPSLFFHRLGVCKSKLLSNVGHPTRYIDKVMAILRSGRFEMHPLQLQSWRCSRSPNPSLFVWLVRCVHWASAQSENPRMARYENICASSAKALFWVKYSLFSAFLVMFSAVRPCDRCSDDAPDTYRGPGKGIIRLAITDPELSHFEWSGIPDTRQSAADLKMFPSEFFVSVFPHL